MIEKSKCVMIAVAATLAVTSSAVGQARQPAARSGGLHAAATAPRVPVTVDRNDPALTGGGSLGYNQTLERGGN